MPNKRTFLTIWLSQLIIVCAISVPLMFWWMGNPPLTGQYARILFSVTNYVGIACGVLALLNRPNNGAGMIVVAVAIAMIIEWIVIPNIVRGTNELWHRAASLAYFVQIALLSGVFWRNRQHD